MKISKIMILFFYAISLFGQTFPEKIAIFPFRVNIQIENPTPHPETELPLLFQDATIFLSKTLYQHEFLESSYINENYPEFREGLTELEAKVQMMKICSKNLFSHFLVGEAYFYSKNSIKIYQSVFSCRTMQKLYSSQITTNEFKLQRDLKKNISKILPFLPENLFYKRWNSQFTKENKIFVLVDGSGSMETLFPVLKNSLNPEVMNIYKIQNNNLILVSNTSQLFGSGELSTKDLLYALNQIQKELIPFESELWIFFDSFDKNAKSFRELGVQLKQISNQGIKIKIFQTYKLEIDKWIEIENFKNLSNVEILPVKYARVCGYSDGSHFSFIRMGRSIYLCNEERENDFLRGINELNECAMLDLYHYTPEELNMDLLCSAYARKNKTKLVYGSSIKTDIERIILKTSKKEQANKLYFKILLKDSTKALWIRLSDRILLNKLLEYKNTKENFYIGLSFYKDMNGVQNVLDKILLPEQKEIPKLFLLKFKELEKREISSEDIYFFFVQILDLRYE
jgi:hypothetical protein